MKPETVFRIVGFAFFAFATVMIYQGEFTEGKTGRVITRAHAPEAFWAAVIFLIGGGCASLYYSRLTRPRRIADLAAADDPREAERAGERPKLPNYDPEFCGKVVKGAACVCVGLIIPEVLVLLHPSDDRCLSWTFRPHQPSAISLWVCVVMLTVVPALWTCNMALRWDHYYSRWMYENIASDPRGPVFTNGGWRMFMAAWCLFCAIPLFLILEQCTALSHYLNVLQF